MQGRPDRHKPPGSAANRHGMFVSRTNFMPGGKTCRLEEQPLKHLKDIPTRNDYYDFS